MSDLAEAMAKLRRVMDEVTQQPYTARYERQEMLSDELAMFRPTYEEAVELLSALRLGLEARVSPHGDDLPMEVGYAFDDLKKAMDKRIPHDIEAYDPRDQYAGPEAEERE